MKKALVITLMFMMGFMLSGCLKSADPEVLALQSQYDDYRSNEFSQYDQFITYINTLSLETAHAAIHVSVTYRQTGNPSYSNESVGMIIDEDQQNYYAVTDMKIFDESVAVSQIVVNDVYKQMSIGREIITNEGLGISLISFSKPMHELFVLSPALAIPFDNEPVMLLSYLQGIRNQLTLGKFVYHETNYQFLSNIAFDDGVLGGGLFDVNHHLVGLIVSIDGTDIVLYEDIWSLLD